MSSDEEALVIDEGDVASNLEVGTENIENDDPAEEMDDVQSDVTHEDDGNDDYDQDDQDDQDDDEEQLEEPSQSKKRAGRKKRKSDIPEHMNEADAKTIHGWMEKWVTDNPKKGIPEKCGTFRDAHRFNFKYRTHCGVDYLSDKRVTQNLIFVCMCCYTLARKRHRARPLVGTQKKRKSLSYECTTAGNIKVHARNVHGLTD